jgi:hypothetical protein
VDDMKNPHQDCLSTIAAFCNPDYVSGNPTRIRDCKDTVDYMILRMNSNWQNVRVKCAQWASSSFTKGNYQSAECSRANLNLQANSYYIAADQSIKYVSKQLTDSVMEGLWKIML